MLGSAILVALVAVHPATAEPQSQVVPIVPETPPRTSWRVEPEKSDDKLEISTRSFFTLLSYPNPQMRGVVAVTDNTRMIWVKHSGLSTIVTGDKMRSFLLGFFNPDEKVEIRFASPSVIVDGPFGRVSRKFSVQEAGRKPECVTFYGEAVHQKPNGWQFTQITFVMGDRFTPCEIVPQ